MHVERSLHEVDESGIGRFVRFRSDVTVDLVPARVAHRLEFGQVSRILSFANRRVIPRDLLDATITKLVEAGITDMPDRCRSILDDRDCEDAGHPVPFRTGRGEPVDLVVGNRNGFPDPLPNRSGLAFEPFAKH